MTRRIALPIIAALLGSLAGCVERTITIESDPPGALVYLNDTEVGRTPVTVPFTFYGTYDVRLELEGHETLSTFTAADGPIWENPGPDLIAEAIPNNKVELKWFYKLEPLLPASPEGMIDRARQLRAKLNNEPLPTSTPAPGTEKTPAPDSPKTGGGTSVPPTQPPPSTPTPQTKK